jgi:hypothetical protein
MLLAAQIKEAMRFNLIKKAPSKTRSGFFD